MTTSHTTGPTGAPTTRELRMAEYRDPAGDFRHDTTPEFRLTPAQYAELLRGISEDRVFTLSGKGRHLQGWDVRRTLTRIFGIGGWSVATTELTLVSQIEHPPGSITYPARDNRPASSNTRTLWTVVYRGQARLTVKNVAGHVIATFEDAAAGDATNQPSLGDAHDLAMKTALTQALKRCAVNLGDQFGLSLYNAGRTVPVVRGTLVHPWDDTARTQPTADVIPDDDVAPGVDPDEARRHGDADIPDGPVIGRDAGADDVLPDGETAPPPAAGDDVLPADDQRARNLAAWLRGSRRTADAIRAAELNLIRQYPTTAAVKVPNERGEDEQLATMFRRYRDAARAAEAAEAASTGDLTKLPAGTPVVMPCGCNAADVTRNGNHGPDCTDRAARRQANHRRAGGNR